MRYGAHIFLWTERWSRSEYPLFERGRSLGLSALEIAVGDDVDYDAKAVRSLAEKNGLTVIVSPGGVWPMAADISSDDASVRKNGIAWHTNWIEKAAESGAAAYTGALYSHPGHVDRRKISDEFEHAAEGLNHLAEHGKKLGVNIVIEPMSHFRVSLINTPTQAMLLIAAADHPNLAVLLDTYHLTTEIRDYAEAARTALPRLWGVHTCENDRGVPGGGIVPWEPFLDTLSNAMFNGYCIFESYNSALRGGDFAFSRGMFHDVCPDGDAFVRQGIRFISSVQ
ncbi:MAG: sugar phosphate isomerase/epimerase family protein [Spirochaetota bacterium]